MASSPGYLSRDTIVALASGAGGAIAVIRLSGPRALEILERVSPWATSSTAAAAAVARGETRPERVLVRSALRDRQGGLLDDALTAAFREPKSFTGEDCVEIHTHGGSYVPERVLEALVAEGARPALPGEFSFRAVRNGKMTLAQAEAVADLIQSSNATAADLALEKMGGLQNRQLGILAEGLRQLAALSEIGIDFSDQDIDEVSLRALKDRLRAAMETLAELKATFKRGAMIQDGVRLAFVGLPNAGKSSLFNALLGEERSIVSEVAGTTRDVVRERITLRSAKQSVTLRLEDTAGLRATIDQVETMGIERTRRAAKEADFLLLLVEAGASTETWAQTLAEWRLLGSPAAKTVGVVTKSDLWSGTKGQWMPPDSLGIRHWVVTSAKSGEGVARAAETIAEFCAQWVARPAGELVLTRLEHVQAVDAAWVHLERALLTSEIELFSADVRQGLAALAPVIGDTVPDDILGRVFSQFCIGK